jgi:hypothetical protein
VCVIGNIVKRVATGDKGLWQSLVGSEGGANSTILVQDTHQRVLAHPKCSWGSCLGEVSGATALNMPES